MAKHAGQQATNLASSNAEVAALVQRLRQGDLQALGELFDYYQEPLLRAIEARMHWSLPARIDPLDILQDAYIDASQRLPHFLSRPDSSIAIWLRLIVLQRLQLTVRHHLMTGKRDARREVSMHRPERAVRSRTSSPEDWLCDSLTSPSQAVMRDETSDRLRRILRQMSRTDCEILMLRHFELLSNEEAAQVLGISPKAASNRYVRALERLRLRMAAEMTAGSTVLPDSH
ncbi:MAG: hypothetical protein KatS3mg111_0896 [Pirellulaceae bacterium]|nr:MAG: hypothetical protein KatS3mg111_0896 [Pirellulaceae bacterium]